MSLCRSLGLLIVSPCLVAASSCSGPLSDDCTTSAVRTIVARAIDQVTGDALTSRLTLVIRRGNAIVDSVSALPSSTGSIESDRLKSESDYIVSVSADGYLTELREGVSVDGTHCGAISTYLVVRMRSSATQLAGNGEKQP